MGIDKNVNLDWNELRDFAVTQIPSIMFVTVSGAHLYGFPSDDSDVDLRGAYLAPLKQILSLEKYKETLEPKGFVNGVEVEMVGHEIGKYLRLLIKPNGYVLEQILSPLIVVTNPMHEELRDLAQASVSRRLYRHYRGFAGGEWREFQKDELKQTVKRLLYIYRVLMTGITLLSEGILECDALKLAPRFGFELEPLVAMKVRETQALPKEAQPYVEKIEPLFDLLQQRYEMSPLPADVPNRAEINDFLVRTRLMNFATLSNEMEG